MEASTCGSSPTFLADPGKKFMYGKAPVIEVVNAFDPFGQWEHGETSRQHSSSASDRTVPKPRPIKSFAPGGSSRSPKSFLPNKADGIIGKYDLMAQMSRSQSMRRAFTVPMHGDQIEMSHSLLQAVLSKGMSLLNQLVSFSIPVAFYRRTLD
ncbi:hypothetical protein AMTR_s00033p00075580 [Amborella trichopoda]|uniref:Uncharacterized protein n=1 Tax=Amborella trichopoda TaxID=13333 RepID=U5D1G0_AMBTC|nr:hypothetical protein AMTR_s00033p00075580 [Amborella trichopoda]